MTHHDLTPIVRSWLRVDRDEDAERVLQLVLGQLDVTPQRRPSWLVRRFPIMNNTKVRYGLAALAVVAAALLGTRLLPPLVGQPTTTPTPTPDLSGMTSLSDAPDACQARADPPVPLPAGDYLVGEPFPLSIGLQVPDGWISWACRSYVFDLTAVDELAGGSAWGLIIYALDENADVYADPCARVLREAPSGTTIGDFMAALADLPGYQVTGPVDTELDGHPGMQIDLIAPEFSYADCGSGPPDSTSNAGQAGHAIFVDSHGSFAMRPGEQVQLRVFDIKGTRLLLVVDDYAGTSAHEEEAGLPASDNAHADDLVELHQMLDTMRIY